MIWEYLFKTFLHDRDDVTEIHANGPGSIFIKTAEGTKKIEVAQLESIDEYNKSIEDLIEFYKIPGGPNFLAEGGILLDTGEKARVHIVLPPVSEAGQVTVAKKTGSLRTLDSLRHTGMFNDNIQSFLEAAIKSRATIILSGGSGAGKTTMLEAMTREFSMSDRIGVVEDVPELTLHQSNVTYQVSTVWKPGDDPNKVATLDWCVRQLNRQRPDRIIIGETRGGEFANFIVAANSGAEGSITTIHANDPKAAVRKMSNFMILGTPQPLRSANDNIAKTIDIIVQIGFNEKGERRVLEISEVTELLGASEDASIVTHQIFKYNDKSDGYTHQHVTDNFRRKLVRGGYDGNTYKRNTPERKDTSGVRLSPLKDLMKDGE